MSTVCLVAQSNNIPEHLAVPLTLLLLLLTAASPLIARAAGVFRRDSVAGPVRHSPSDTPATFLLMLIAAVLATIVGISLLQPLLIFLPEQHRALAAGMLGTGFGFLAVILANIGPRPGGLRLMGLSGGGVLSGFWAGLVGLVVVLPWLFWLMLAAQYILQKFNVHVPTEHEIFRIWQQPETSRAFRGVAIFSAVILAPLAEEAIFRGVLQTGLVRLLARRGEPHVPAPGARWLAILLTSLLFALVHQPWFIMLPIFLLSLGLGYVYERTGNLWSAIFMHLFFNAAQFTLFLFAVR